ncbi:glycosyltransferase family 2 protein [Rhodopseudomonas sp. BAL398]|nr:glycosyltransferase [Rhodopseudomonas sp. BAL398]WOK17707.1 glycosyltransferase family 2 protein [Rhodopseudomonas sp. BAL398]
MVSPAAQSVIDHSITDAVDTATASIPARPFVTIAIPTFNRAHLLSDCVRAALAQTYPHFEVLVSDNASEDHTQDVLATFNDKRLRIIRQPRNIGLLPNWNACLAAARGDYIVCVSDDDRLAPGMLEVCVRTMNGRPHLPIVVGLSNLDMVALGRIRPCRVSRVLETGAQDGAAILREFLADRITVTNCSIMARTELVRRNGGFWPQLRYTADVVSWAPLLLQGMAGFVNEACATYRLHDLSATASLSIETRLDEGRAAGEIIAASIDPRRTSARQRKMLRYESHRWFARRNLMVLSDYRKAGASIGEIVSLIWKFRSYLHPVDSRAAAHFLAVLLLPRTLTHHLRRMRHPVTVAAT